jgi:hypothetical protein
MFYYVGLEDLKRIMCDQALHMTKWLFKMFYYVDLEDLKLIMITGGSFQGCGHAFVFQTCDHAFFFFLVFGSKDKHVRFFPNRCVIMAA